jgi:hypothetical protein
MIIGKQVCFEYPRKGLHEGILVKAGGPDGYRGPDKPEVYLEFFLKIIAEISLQKHLLDVIVTFSCRFFPGVYLFPGKYQIPRFR